MWTRREPRHYPGNLVLLFGCDRQDAVALQEFVRLRPMKTIMHKIKFVFLFCTIFALSTPAAYPQTKDFVPVTREMLMNPSPDDWLMLSRTYDEQRFSPLQQITRQNVSRLRMEWVRGMPQGTQETVPTIYRGVMYVNVPGAVVEALDATNGDLIWEYRHQLPEGMSKAIAESSRSKSLAIYQDLIFYTAPDGYLIALDARTGAVRWKTLAHDPKTSAQATSAPIVVEGKVITGRACNASREGCFIAAHDALTGKELWKFYVTAAPGEPGGDSWGDVPVDKRIASTWGLPGSYDPVRKLLYWAVANPTPYPRIKRHGGNADAIPRSAPADLYSDSTLALDPETGKLVWYYQHLPGDDWDLDHTHERVLLRTPFNPDPSSVKWINPKIPRGSQRDMVVEMAEAGGIWALDPKTGEFLWATPFPYDVPQFHISRIDVETGKSYINWDSVAKKDGERHTVCFQNSKGYFAMAYYPAKNSMYIPYNDTCLDMEAKLSNNSGFGIRQQVPRPGDNSNNLGGLARVNMETGKVEWRYEQHAPTVGSVLATAGDVIFWGDLNRRFRAFDADSGKILWEGIVGGIVQNSTITYAVNGRQYIAVLTGDGDAETRLPLAMVPDIKPPRGHNAIYVFALPETARQ
jgi:PQQ-dependent dehydrogenase (methanol/ethanol family)